MMKKQTGSTQFPALRRLAVHSTMLHSLAAGAMLCAAITSVPAVAAEEAALYFVGADIESVIKAVGHYTGMTFIIAPRVKGTLTLVSERTLTKAQAFKLLTSALRLQGYAVVTADGYAKVVPEAEAKLQSSPTHVGKGAPKVRRD